MNQGGIKRLLRFAMCVPALVLLVASVGGHAQQGVVPGAMLVRLRPGNTIERVARDYGLFVLDTVLERDVYEVSALDQDSSLLIELFLSYDSRVRYCEEEGSIASPEVQATPFHISFDVSADSRAYINQPAYQMIDLGTLGSGNANSSNSSGGSDAASVSVIVAVLDTGVDPTQPDLKGSLVSGLNTLNPGSPPVDIADGKNNNEVGHGTMIAGLIARTAPNSMIMPIRVLNADGVGTLMHVIKGIHYAVRHGVGVINMSFETSRYSVALADALEEAYNAGIVLIASAGNDSTSAPRYPAALPEVIGVASVEDNNTLSPFSNFGVNASLVAPGSNIRSTYLGSNFATWSGTSFAAPFVTALAAEVLVSNPDWTPAQVVFDILQTSNSVDYLNPGFANMLGAGIIDVQAAIGGQNL